MGNLVPFESTQPEKFQDTRSMLNLWWSEQTRKPMTEPKKIKWVVDRAVKSGWTLNECYKALDITWAFTEYAFEVALRRLKDEDEGRYGRVGARIISLRDERKKRGKGNWKPFAS